jgi:hypothetical protein
MACAGLVDRAPWVVIPARSASPWAPGPAAHVLIRAGCRGRLRLAHLLFGRRLDSGGEGSTVADGVALQRERLALAGYRVRPISGREHLSGSSTDGVRPGIIRRDTASGRGLREDGRAGLPAPVAQLSEDRDQFFLIRHGVICRLPQRDEGAAGSGAADGGLPCGRHTVPSRCRDSSTPECRAQSSGPGRGPRPE